MDSGTSDMREFVKNTKNIYEAVAIAAKRARQLHENTTNELKKRIGEIENEEDLEEETIDREKIVREFDNRDKPSMVAIQELIDGKIRRIKENDEEQDKVK